MIHHFLRPASPTLKLTAAAAVLMFVFLMPTGDLHMRQGNQKKAIEAFEKALRQSFSSGGDFYNQITFPPGGLSPTNQRLMKKLGAAQIGAGNFEKARQVLDNLSRAEAAASKASKNGPSQFPAQLVVSVMKSDLDAIANGKIKSEEFKKRASLRYLDPSDFQQKESKSGTSR